MKNYQYQIIRYIHDRFTSEFVNVGIILFNPEEKFLKACFIGKYGRVSQFFNNINGHHLLTALKSIEREIDKLAKKIEEPSVKDKNLDELVSLILPKDDSALIASELLKGLDIDCDSAIYDLYERIVNKYSDDLNEEKRDDKYVWKKIYKQYFDKYNITKNLKPHSVKTSFDTINFDKAWKNDIWHCYETVSFDLKRIDSIRNKVYKWSGILNELEKSDEKIALHFLTSSPARHRDIEHFINETLIRDKENLNVSLVKEDEAEQFAQKLNEEIKAHYSLEDEPEF